MANVTETSQWVGGIYQLEITDPVEAGAGGISNLQSKQLGDRTKWLYDKLIPKNKGWFSGLDISGSVGNLTVSGDVTAAVASIPSSGDSVVLVTMLNAMPSMNYKVNKEIESMSTSINNDNDVSCPVFKKISTTQFQMGFKEVGTVIQNLKIHIDVISLD